MLYFCPTCANLLVIEEGEHCLRFTCQTCPYVFNVARKITNRIYPRLKEVDDVLGGSAAWENVDSTAERCPKCSHPRAYFMQIQTRSADEPMTTFYKCCNHECAHRMVTRTTKKMMELVRVTADPKAAAVAAVKQLQKGQVVAVPTDTVYGLATSAQDANAVKLLYQIKGRDEQKPVAICVSKVSDVGLWGQTSKLPEDLLNDLLPGPVTVVLKRTKRLNPALNPHTRLVGIRVTDDVFMRSVGQAFQGPIALTSANRSGEPSPLDAREFQHLWPALGLVCDGGILAGNRAGSTVVDLSLEQRYTILRDGSALANTLDTLHKFGLTCSVK